MHAWLTLLYGPQFTCILEPAKHLGSRHWLGKQKSLRVIDPDTS